MKNKRVLIVAMALGIGGLIVRAETTNAPPAATALPPGGIGAIIEKVGEGMLVLEVRSESPAAKAGIKTGDILVEANGKSLKDATVREVIQQTRGAVGSQVELKVKRANEKNLLTFKLTRAAMPVSPSYPIARLAEPPPKPAEPPPPFTAPEKERYEYVVKQLQAINEKLDRQESLSRFGSSMNRGFQSRGPDLAALAKIKFPDQPTKENLGNYVRQILNAANGQNSYSESDPQVAMLARVGEENIELLLEVTGSETHSLHGYHVVPAIRTIATEKSKPLILKMLPARKSLSDVVFARGWQAEARDTLLAGLKSQTSLPDSWIRAVASLNDPATYPHLIYFFIHGSNRSRTYELIQYLPGIKIGEKEIIEAWEASKLDRFSPYTSASVAALAVSYGREDALDALVRALSNDSYEANRALSALIQYADGGTTKEDILRWYAKAKGNLVFDKAAKKFRMKPEASAKPNGGVLTPTQAAELAAKLANEKCEKGIYAKRPFTAGQYPAVLEDGLYHWGRLEAIGPGGYSARVTFKPDGSDAKVEVRFSTDSRRLD